MIPVRPSGPAVRAPQVKSEKSPVPGGSGTSGGALPDLPRSEPRNRLQSVGLQLPADQFGGVPGQQR